jgi:hypothetical protein
MGLFEEFKDGHQQLVARQHMLQVQKLKVADILLSYLCRLKKNKEVRKCNGSNDVLKKGQFLEPSWQALDAAGPD